MNDTKNQEFNKNIKQLQSMVRDKLIISLAEKFYNLKSEIASLFRAVKDKENSLMLDSYKKQETEIKPKEPEVEVKPASEVKPVQVEASKPVEPRPQPANKQPYKPNQNFGDKPYNNRPYNAQQGNRFNNKQNPNQFRKPFQPNRLGPDGKPIQGFNRNPNFKPGQNNRPMANKDNRQRPAINYAQPVITVSPTRNYTQNKKKPTDRQDEKRGYSKRDLLKRGMIVDSDEDRVINRKVRSKKKDASETIDFSRNGPVTITTDNITVKLLSEQSGVPVSEIIKKFMQLGMMMTINSVIDFGTAELVMSDMNIQLVQKLDKTSEEKLKDIQQNIRSYDESEASVRPPIVTVMGHVDHGKTSLLDYIRKSKVAVGEAGGITQAIGAYRVKVADKYITFIDTPGHEAFTAMRARGASVTDIAILIVAADDGIMPQTVEAINHIKSAGIPMIVAINKMDKPQADPDRVMQQLAEHNVLPEAWGGDAIICKISAHTGEGIDKLLETILLVADVQDLKANPNIPAMGTVLEARLDKGRGAIASVIVKDGSLKVGDTIVSGTTICKVKAMFDEHNKVVKVATPSMPVTVLGFSEVPTAGDVFTVVDEKLSKQIVEDRKTKIKEDLIKSSGGNSLEDLLQKTSEKDMKILNIVLKTDVHGSLEAIKSSIMKLTNDEVKINILHSGVGAISESDLILASASNAMLIAFNIGQDSKVKTQADRLKIKIYSYKIIYELLDEIERVIKGMEEPKYEEEYLGEAKVMMVFKLSSVGIVAGSMVMNGKIVRGEHARIYRGDELIATTEIKSLKYNKDDIKEAGKDRECGIKTNYDDVKEGDRIECYTLKRIN